MRVLVVDGPHRGLEYTWPDGMRRFTLPIVLPFKLSAPFGCGSLDYRIYEIKGPLSLHYVALPVDSKKDPILAMREFEDDRL